MHPGNPRYSDFAENEAYDVLFYFLDLNISDSSTHVQGAVTIRLKTINQPLQELTFDQGDVLITDSVKVNEQRFHFTHTGNKLSIHFDNPQVIGSEFAVQIYYHGLGKNTSEVQGIYNKINTTWNQRVTWTLSEPFSALNWFPCKQSLTDKADSAYIFLSTDRNLKAGSNGLLTQSVLLPGNRVRYEWKTRHPIDYYLISFAVSNYRDYSFYARFPESEDSLLIQNYIYNNEDYFTQTRADIDKTADMLYLFAELFGRYPFHDEKYGHCVAPAGGGMEHQTMTTLSNFSFLLVAHELAHQWFGDYVTCASWQEIWLNEGFASYSEYLAKQSLVSQAQADNWIIRTQDYVKMVPGGSVYVPVNSAGDEDRIFDYRLSYAKGAAIIHMIRQEVGNDTLFFKILREYLNRSANGNGRVEAFKTMLSEMTGRSFTSFFDQWYYGEGYPTHTITWNQYGDTLNINSLQTTSSTTPLFNVLIEFKITVNGRDTILALRQNKGYDNWKFYIPGQVTAVIADPHHWLLYHVAGLNQLENTSGHARYTVGPNPSRDKVSVRFREPVDKYRLYFTDSTGRILFSEESDNMHAVLDVSHYAKGIYIIIVEVNNALYPTKFLIN